MRRARHVSDTSRVILFFVHVQFLSVARPCFDSVTAVSSDASIDFIDPELNSFARTKIWQAFLLGMISFGGD